MEMDYRCPSRCLAASLPLIYTEVDFDSVFGGPPQRILVKDRRDNFHSNVDGAAEYRIGRSYERRRRSEVMIRKPSFDLYDDIFRCDDFDGLRFDSKHSSLHDELGKRMEIPVWNSVSHSPGRRVDNYPSSRLLRHVSQSWNDEITEKQLCDGKTPLYIEFSLTSDGTVKVLKNVMDDEEDSMKQKMGVSETAVNCGQFNLCNWANKDALPITTINGEVKLRQRTGNLDVDIEIDEPGENLADGVSASNIELQDEIMKHMSVQVGRKPDSQTMLSKYASSGSYMDKQDAKGIISGNHSDLDKSIVQSSPGETNGRERLKEKVKELVAMFNQNSSSKSKMLTETLSQSSDGNGNAHCAMAVEKIKPETKPNVVESLETPKKDESENGDSGKESSTFVHKDTSFKHVDIFSQGSVSDSYQDGNDSSSDPIDEFEVKELAQEQNIVSQTDGYQQGIQESDVKIKQWSSGKEGNIRSLLSTMQHVLWPGSGWKPVALVDIIETNQVKKTYQRALLYVHPDKVQQKGVAEHQIYLAKRVFDILQESWNHFNTLTSL